MTTYRQMPTTLSSPPTTEELVRLMSRTPQKPTPPPITVVREGATRPRANHTSRNARKAIEAAERVLKGHLTCVWWYDPDHDKWNSECDNAFQFFDGGPTANGFAFCPYCGSKIPPSEHATRDAENET